jgi:regulator of sigma E protease
LTVHDVSYIAITAVTFIVVLGVLVMVHELGHFLTARLFGVRVEEFGIGFPPRAYPGRDVVQRRRAQGKTVYSLNWLPLGGFVRLAGENGVTAQPSEPGPEGETRGGSFSLSGDAVSAEDPGAFASKPAWQRAIILAAGAFNNMVLAMLLVVFIFAVIGTPRVDIAVAGVAAGSPASDAGILYGDVIRRVDGIVPQDQSDVRTIVANHPNQPTTLELSRNGRTITVQLMARGQQDVPCDQGPIGIITNPTNQHYAPAGLDRAASAALSVPGTVVGGLATLLGSLFSGQQAGGTAPGTSVQPSNCNTAIPLPSRYATAGGQYATADHVVSVPGALTEDPCLAASSSGVGVTGPIGIVRQVGCEANAIPTQGWVPLLTLVVELSATLAVMNLLPIPALDGGRLLFVLISVVARRRIRPEVEGMAHAIGMAALLTLMLFISWYDLANLIHNRPAF